jgi:MSHA pilin protein MshA
MRKSSGGFTLIELIVVIVILGILAVTAAPKFMNLQGDAKAASLKGVQAALNSAKSMVYAKALLNSAEKKENTTVTVNGDDVAIVYGYPAATKVALGKVLDVDFDNDYHLVASDGVAHVYIIDPSATGDSSYGQYTGKCEVVYTEAEDADTPATAVAITTDC